MEAANILKTIDLETLVQAKYFDLSGKTLTIGEVIALRNEGKNARDAFTSVKEIMKRSMPISKTLPAKGSIDKTFLVEGKFPNMPTVVDTAPAAFASTIRKKYKALTGNSLFLNMAAEGRPRAFTPDYKVTLYDVMSVRSCLQLEAIGQLAGINTSNLANEVIEIAENHYYGNGTLEGQLNRLAKANALGLSLRDSNEKHTPPHHRFFPLNNIEKRLRPTLDSLMTSSTSYVQPSSNPKSNPGPPFNKNVKRDQTALQEVISFMDITNGLLDSYIDWAYVPYMKPKNEIYKISEYRSKTRNYWAYNSSAVTPINVLAVAASQCHTKTPLTPGINHSLAKMSVLQDMAWQFITFAKNTDRPTMCAVYSDNLFIIRKSGDDITITSMDGEKMEASAIKKETAYGMNEYIISKTLDRGDDELINTVNTITKKCINGYGILYGVTYMFTGLSSGLPTTFTLNHYRMGNVATAIEDQGTLLSNDEIIKIARENGVSLTIELEYNMKTVEEMLNNPMTLTMTGSVVPADLLGFDIGALKLNGKTDIVTILNRERIIKAMTFSKPSSVQGRNPLKLVIRYISNYTLYIMGGWYHPDIALWIKTFNYELLAEIKNMRQKMTISNATYAEIIRELLDSMQVDEQMIHSLSMSLMKSYIPSIESVVRIICKNITVNDLIQDIKNDPVLLNKAHLLLNQETLISEKIPLDSKQTKEKIENSIQPNVEIEIEVLTPTSDDSKQVEHMDTSPGVVSTGFNILDIVENEENNEIEEPEIDVPLKKGRTEIN